MRKKLRWINLLLVVYLLTPSIVWSYSEEKGENAVVIDGYKVYLPEAYTFNMDLTSDLSVSKPMRLTIIFGDKLKKNKYFSTVKITLSEGIEHISGDLEFELEPGINYKDIHIWIKEYGEYDISISVGEGLLIKEYSIDMYKEFSSYGPKGNKMVLEEIRDNGDQAEENRIEKETVISTTNIDSSGQGIKLVNFKLEPDRQPIEYDKIHIEIGEITLIQEIGPNHSRSNRIDVNTQEQELQDLLNLVTPFFLLNSHILLNPINYMP
ncbi:MAG: hypothetical protein AB2421_05305 [Thermotaleaceae bacterium]